VQQKRQVLTYLCYSFVKFHDIGTRNEDFVRGNCFQSVTVRVKVYRFGASTRDFSCSQAFTYSRPQKVTHTRHFAVLDVCTVRTSIAHILPASVHGSFVNAFMCSTHLGPLCPGYYLEFKHRNHEGLTVRTVISTHNFQFGVMYMIHLQIHHMRFSRNKISCSVRLCKWPA
jgi:hypothetical protein